MTLHDELFRTAVVDGGALGAVAIDIATRTAIAGFAHADLASPALLDLLLGTVRPSGPLTQLGQLGQLGGEPPDAAARELFVAGKDRALYCTVVDHRELIVIATPATMSVALGWALVRVLAAARTAP